jgi:hypothetical protein
MGNFFSDSSNEEEDYDNLEEPEPVRRKTKQSKYFDDYDDDDDDLEKEYEREYVPATKSKTRRRKTGAKNKSKANRRY